MGSEGILLLQVMKRFIALNAIVASVSITKYTNKERMEN
jgi:hypothetical protein